MDIFLELLGLFLQFIPGCFEFKASVLVFEPLKSSSLPILKALVVLEWKVNPHALDILLSDYLHVDYVSPNMHQVLFNTVALRLVWLRSKVIPDLLKLLILHGTIFTNLPDVNYSWRQVGLSLSGEEAGSLF